MVNLNGCCEAFGKLCVRAVRSCADARVGIESAGMAGSGVSVND